MILLDVDVEDLGGLCAGDERHPCTLVQGGRDLTAAPCSAAKTASPPWRGMLAGLRELGPRSGGRARVLFRTAYAHVLAWKPEERLERIPDDESHETFITSANCTPVSGCMRPL